MRFERIFFLLLLFPSIKNECQREDGDGKGQGPVQYFSTKKKGREKEREREKIKWRSKV